MKNQVNTTKDDAFNRKDFLWMEDQNEWHINRQEKIREKYGAEIKKLEGNDPYSIFYFLAMTVSHWVVAVSFALYFQDKYFILALCGWFLGGYWAVAGGLAMHEAAH